MKIKIDSDYPVTTLSGEINFDPQNRSLLTARTREGKTLLGAYGLAKAAEEDYQSINLAWGPDLGSYTDDFLGKFESIPELAGLEINCHSYRDKQGKQRLLEKFANVNQGLDIWAINSNHSYVDNILKLIAANSNRRINAFIDEAHKTGVKTYHRLLHELLKYPNLGIIESTATFRNRILTKPGPKVEILRSRSGIYVHPTAATLIPVDRNINAWTRKHDCLADEYLDEIVRELTKPEALISINGNHFTGFHTNVAWQLDNCCADIDQSDVAVVTVNGGTARWRGIRDSGYDNTIYHEGTKKAIKDVSSIVRYVYNKCFKKIILIGHRQMEMGQTIGFPGFPMTLQIIITAKSIKSTKADNLAQWVRTGGNGVGTDQRIMMIPELWEDYKIYVDKNEELAKLFYGKSPEEQAELAKEQVLNLSYLKVEDGDYKRIPATVKDTDKLPLLTWIREIDCPSEFLDDFNYVEGGKTRNTIAVRKFITQEIKQDERWLPSTPVRIRTIAGDINTDKRGRGGNDVQVYVHADPQAPSGQSWARNITAWLRDGTLVMRVRPNLEPQCGKYHGWFGEDDIRLPKSSKEELV